MDPITIVEILVICAIVYIIFLIYNWSTSRYAKCGKKDPLCYITGEPTSAINIIQNLF